MFNCLGFLILIFNLFRLKVWDFEWVGWTSLDIKHYMLRLFFLKKVKKKVYALSRSGKSDSTRTEQTKILPELTSELIDLKFTRIENDPYRTELDLNIFCLNHFVFKKSLLDQKSAYPKLIRAETDPTRNPT